MSINWEVLAVTQRLTIGNASWRYSSRKEIIWKFVGWCEATGYFGNSLLNFWHGLRYVQCFLRIGFATIFWYFWVRTPGCISIKGEVLSSWNCLHPSFISPAAESRESSCKQTGEIEHRHSTFEPRVYHRLYILRWLCLKISPHIQTTAAVCAWAASVRCVWGQNWKLDN